jgi:cation transporter-like permease
MSANPLSSLVQAIVSDPSSLLATALSSAFSSRLGLAPDSVELALKAYASDNNLTRAALVGLLLEGL